MRHLTLAILLALPLSAHSATEFTSVNPGALKVDDSYIPDEIARDTEVTAAISALTKADIDLGNVPNVDTTDAANITSGVLDDARIPLTIPRTVDGLYQDKDADLDTWAAISPSLDVQELVGTATKADFRIALDVYETAAVDGAITTAVSGKQDALVESYCDEATEKSVGTNPATGEPVCRPDMGGLASQDYTFTGNIDFSGAASIILGPLQFADAATPPSEVGGFRYVNTITGLDDGGIQWYDDDELQTLVGLDSSEVLAADDDGKALKYNHNGGAGYFSLGTATGGSSYVATPWTYSDETCTAGEYAADTSHLYLCVADGNIDRIAVTDWNNPSPVTGCSGTVGNTTLGSTQEKLFGTTFPAGGFQAVRLPIGCAGTVAAVEIYAKYFSAADKDAILYVYSDNGLGTSPGSPLATLTTETNAGTAGPLWWSQTVNYTAPDNTDFLWFVVNREGSGSIFYRESDGVTGTVYPIRGKTGVFGSPPDPWGASDYTSDTTIPLINITYQ